MKCLQKGARHLVPSPVLSWYPFEFAKNIVMHLNVGLIYGFIPDNKVHEANMGPTWVRQDPGGTQVGPMNLAIRADLQMSCNNLTERYGARKVIINNTTGSFFMTTALVSHVSGYCVTTGSGTCYMWNTIHAYHVCDISKIKIYFINHAAWFFAVNKHITVQTVLFLYSLKTLWCVVWWYCCHDI